jgi:hypothetical protein
VRRNWLIAAIVVGIAAIVLAAVLARTLGDDDSGPSEETVSWTSSVCTSLATWQASIESIANVAATGLSKESLQQAFDDAATATDQLVSELKALGPPDLDSGAQVEQQLEASVDELSADYEEIKASAEQALDADSTAELLGALASLAPKFQELVASVNGMLETLQSEDVAAGAQDELEQAFSEAESCQELQAGAGSEG